MVKLISVAGKQPGPTPYDNSDLLRGGKIQAAPLMSERGADIGPLGPMRTITEELPEISSVPKVQNQPGFAEPTVRSRGVKTQTDKTGGPAIKQWRP